MVGKGLSKGKIEEISFTKKEPEWMRSLRLESYEIFNKIPMPSFGPDLSGLDLSNINF